MKNIKLHLFLSATILLLTGCSTVPYTQTEQTEHARTENGRLYQELAPGCVTAEEYNYLTGIWNSGQDSLALQIPLCKAT
ncbi:MAG: hypothetical protein IIT57_02370, partial [Treponema sp.]|nr:hypothetical protein [Treponema sp.]